MARREVKRDMVEVFEKDVEKWLKKHGCIVKRTDSPTFLFIKEGFWGAIECKATARSKFQPGQKEMVAKLDDWSWARVAYPSNWDTIKKELEEILK